MALAATLAQQDFRERFVSGRRFGESLAEPSDCARGKPRRLRMFRVGAAPRGSRVVLPCRPRGGFRVSSLAAVRCLRTAHGP